MQRLTTLLGHVAPAASAFSFPEACAVAAVEEGPAVLYAVQGKIATITLNRASKRNAMTEELLSGVQAAAQRAAADASLRCVVVVGKGRNFCGGADFRSGNRPQKSSTSSVPLMPGEASMGIYTPFLALLDIRVPVIAAMQGHAIGGGFGLALCCDLRVAHEGSQYGANFVKLGLHPGMAITYMLPRLLGVPKALELLLTGRLVSGREATELGLCSSYAGDPDGVVAKAHQLAEEIAANAPVAVRFTKHSVYRHLGWDPRSAAWDEAQLQAQTASTEDFREGAKALLEKRRPTFHGR